jgi:cytochrome c biogenesis protein CcmG, thiol:disulfide interchange protein DsbE
MYRRALLGIAVAAVVIAALVAAACGGSSDPAPDLQGTTLQGKAFDLADLKGKPTVVNFFASWCPPCNSEAPDLADFAKAHPEVQIVGVATDDAEADAKAFVEKYDLPYTIVLDADSSIAGEWGVQGIPHTSFIDAKGNVREVVVGAATLAQFEVKLAALQ